MMRARDLAALLAAVALVSCSSGEKKPARELSNASEKLSPVERLSAAMEKRIAMGLAPGMVAAVRADGKTSLLVRGRRSIEPPAAFSEKDLVEIGSVTKLMTGILIELAIGEGRMIRETRLSSLFPSLVGVPAGAITIQELGIHASGLPRVVEGYVAPDSLDPYRAIRAKDVLDPLLSWKKPSALPKDGYSNWGYLLLGLALERAYGRSYPEILRERLVKPLRLGETGVDRAGRTRRRGRSRLATKHDAADDPQPAWSFAGFAAAAGGAEMSVREMAAFLDALESPPRSAIGRAIEASMRSGIGWDSAPGDAVLWKNGGTSGFRSMLALHPATRRAVFVAANTSVEVDTLALHALGLAPRDSLVATIESGRPAPDAEEVERLKGSFAFSRYLDEDEDEIDAAKVPDTAREETPAKLEILQRGPRLVGRIGEGGKRLGFSLFPEPEEEAWRIVEGASNREGLLVRGDGAKTRVLFSSFGAPGIRWLEYRKIEKKPESYPAIE